MDFFLLVLKAPFDIDALQKMVNEGNTPSKDSPGQPISFRLKTLKGNNYAIRSAVTDFKRSQ